MAQQCTTCTHLERGEIDKLLATGTSASEVARTFQLNERSVRRHEANHLPPALQAAAQADDEARDIDVVAEVKKLYNRTVKILDDNADSPKTSLPAIREARDTLALLGKLLGTLDERPQMNILIAPQWVTIRTALLQALLPYPEARQAVAEALLEADHAADSE